MGVLIFFALLTLLVLALDVAAIRIGADSRHDIGDDRRRRA